MSKGRLEAFSDGVFAVAITLLVLDIDIPPAGGDLGHAVGKLWPSFAAYGVSFFTIGIIWVNHHASVGRLVTADRTVLFLNLNLLLWVVLIPWTTAVFAEHLRDSGANEHLAAAMYAANLLIMGFSFWLINRHSAAAKLLPPDLDPKETARLVRRNLWGQAAYVVAFALAWISAPVSLIICGLVAFYYMTPGAMGVGASNP